MVKQRSFLLVIVFNAITLGIYGLYWIHAVAKETNTICAGDGRKTRGLLLVVIFSCLTLGIYGYVWYFMLGDRIQDIGPRYNLTIKESGGTLLLWLLLGVFIIIGPFISLYIVTKNMNALAIAYNEKNPTNNGQGSPNNE